MQNTKWSCNAGADHWNVCIGHSMILLIPAQANCKFPPRQEGLLPLLGLSKCHSEQSEESRIISGQAPPSQPPEMFREACPERSRRAQHDSAIKNESMRS